MRYFVRQKENVTNELLHKSGRIDLVSGPFTTEHEFINKYGEPPWEYVNHILNKLELPYTVTYPNGIHQDEQFICAFTHKESEAVVHTTQLSTGEKVLLSLLLAIYINNNVDTVKLLILDEPDAPLHPSMSKLMVTLIEEELVKK